MDKTLSKKKRIILYLFFSFIISYFASIVRMKTFYIDISSWNINFLLSFMLSILLIHLIIKAYYFVFNYFIKVKENFIFNPYLYITIIISLPIFVFIYFLNSFVIKKDNLNYLDLEGHKILSDYYGNILSNLQSIILYLIIAGIIFIIIYQIVKIYKQKVPFFRSLIAVIVSMAVLLLLLDWLVYILDILSGMF